MNKADGSIEILIARFDNTRVPHQSDHEMMIPTRQLLSMMVQLYLLAPMDVDDGSDKEWLPEATNQPGILLSGDILSGEPVGGGVVLDLLIVGITLSYA